MTYTKHYPDRPRRAPNGNGMRQMVARKRDNDAIDAIKTALRASAHAYHVTSQRKDARENVENVGRAGDDLYAAARALAAAEIAAEVRAGATIEQAVQRVLLGGSR